MTPPVRSSGNSHRSGCLLPPADPKNGVGDRVMDLFHSLTNGRAGSPVYAARHVAHPAHASQIANEEGDRSMEMTCYKNIGWRPTRSAPTLHHVDSPSRPPAPSASPPR